MTRVRGGKSAPTGIVTLCEPLLGSAKDGRFHEAVTCFTMCSYNFCWPVRTLREREEWGCWRERTPAMAAGLSDTVSRGPRCNFEAADD